MGEFELIDNFKKILAKPSKSVLVGIGDDTAVTLPPKSRLLWTIDCVVENIHFDFSYSSPKQVGWKALAVNLSDIAAMGGRSCYALVSLVIPKRITEKKLSEIYQGIKECAQWAKVDVIGGNISRGQSDFVIDITVIGEASRPLTRSGAKEGECVAVTGASGFSAAGFCALKKWGKRARSKYPESTEHHLRPKPRLDFAQVLAKNGVSSLIDISDGLSSELNHLSKESKVGIEIEEKLLPFEPEVKKIAEEMNRDPLSFILHGGEEYELLMTFPFSKFASISGLALQYGVPLTMIGHTVRSPRKVQLRDRKGKLKNLLPKGWTHF